MKETEELSVGDFGRAIFYATPGDLTSFTDCRGRIKIVEKKYILFEDNNEHPYIIERKDLKFKKEKFKIHEIKY